MKNSAKLIFLASLCLVLNHCSMRSIKVREPESTFKTSKNEVAGRCIALARRRSTQEHFTLRFGQRASTTVGELLVKKAFLDAKRFQDVHVASSSPFRSDEEDDLKAITARLGCEMVFGYREIVRKETSYNFLSIFYPTIIGMFVFPGTNFQMGVSWDVSVYSVNSEAPIVEGRWYGISKLYHFRPGSYEHVSTRAYQEAVSNLVSRGMENLL